MNNDSISREWLEDAFDNLCCHNCKICRNFRIEDSFYKCALIDNAPPVERPKSEWIPVSERLPDLFEVVLVTDETNNVFEYERRPLDEEGNVCREWSFLGRKIIAWMPLPEPYKVDS